MKMKTAMSALLLVSLVLSACAKTEPSETTASGNSNTQVTTATPTTTTYPPSPPPTFLPETLPLPPEPTVDTVYAEAYGNYDYSLKPYFSDHAYVYKNRIYYLSTGGELVYVSLNDLTADDDLSKNKTASKTRIVRHLCTGEGHAHGRVGVSLDCPTNMRDYSEVILDPCESAGESPVFYCVFSLNTTDGYEPESWELTEPFKLYRYDSAQNKREELIELSGRAAQMMLYGDKIFMVLRTSETQYKLMVYDKKAKDVQSMAVGEGRSEYIGADDNYVYFCNWQDGTLYRADHRLLSSEAIFKANEVFAKTAENNGTIGMFIHDGKLYYRADISPFKVAVDQSDPDGQYFDLKQYSIRRLPLDALDGEGELVASGIQQDGEINVVGNSLYYVPADYGTNVSGCYYNLNNGRLCKVNLETLESTDVISDCGLFFDNGWYGSTNGRYILTTIRPTSFERLSEWSLNDAAAYFALYDLENGSLFSMISH